MKANKALQHVKKALKHRFWADIYAGAKIFYIGGILQSGKYARNETAARARVIYAPMANVGNVDYEDGSVFIDLKTVAYSRTPTSRARTTRGARRPAARPSSCAGCRIWATADGKLGDSTLRLFGSDAGVAASAVDDEDEEEDDDDMEEEEDDDDDESPATSTATASTSSAATGAAPGGVDGDDGAAWDDDAPLHGDFEAGRVVVVRRRRRRGGGVVAAGGAREAAAEKKAAAMSLRDDDGDGGAGDDAAGDGDDDDEENTFLAEQRAALAKQKLSNEREFATTPRAWASRA
ncbi:U3 snoRNA binding protein [Aureococcus anophagefferens]|nr:U3 snoRNA binding protein [Aureococcus anophagefferens]